MKSYTFNTYKLGVSLVVLFTGTLLACAATVATDQADYPPGSTAVITGSGFTPGETVELQVINLTNPGDIGVEHDPWPVTADAEGNFTTTWYVTEDEANTTLQLTATGLTSGLTAQETFTDATFNISSISIGSQNRLLTNGVSGSVTYTITNFFSGNGQSVGAVTNRVTAGLPAGANASFSLVPTTGPGSGGSSGNSGAFTNLLTITSAASTPAGTYTITVVGDDNKNGHTTNTTTLTVSVATATKLVFSTQPASTTAGSTLASVAVQIQDANGNNVASNNVPITVALNTGSFAGGSTTTVNSDATGKATFSNLKINMAGSYTLTASASGIGAGLSGTTSSSFTVVPAAASAIVVTGYPSPRNAGLPGTFTNTVVDQFGNVATNYTGTVRFTSSDSQASFQTNSYPFTAADAGVYVLTGTRFGTAGSQSLTATDTSNPAITGTQSGIIIIGGTVNKLVFSTQPAGAIYKTPFTTQPVVKTQDAYGNDSTNGLPASLIVSLALTAGAGPLAGTATVDIGTDHGAGIATFSGLQLNKAENGDALTASASGYTSATSSPFNVSPRSLTVTATGVNKTYDGSTNATVTLSDNKVSGDNVTDSYTSASFATQAVGTGKTVAVTGISISGPDAGNYSLASTTATTTANITAAACSISVSSSLNPAGYKAGVNFLAAGLPADATGNVIFLANRAPFSTNTLSGGSATSVTISLLPRGTNTITAQYAGDGNYLGSTSDLAFGQMVTNHPPVAGTFVYTNATRTFKLAIASLLTNNVTDADGDAISLAGFSVSTNGVNLLTNATVLYYSNTNYCSDQFSYIVKDGFGGSSTGLVSVVFDPFNSGTLSTGQSGKVNLQANGASLRFNGIPNYRYSIQRTTNLVDWVTIGATNAASNGVLDYNDNFNNSGPKPDIALYRLVWTP